MRATSCDVNDEAQPAGIVLVLRVVQALFFWKGCLCHLESVGSQAAQVQAKKKPSTFFADGLSKELGSATGHQELSFFVMTIVTSRPTGSTPCATLDETRRGDDAEALLNFVSVMT